MRLSIRKDNFTHNNPLKLNYIQYLGAFTIAPISSNLFVTIVDILCSLLLVVQVIAVIAFFTLFERKLLSSVQRRRGPDVVGFWGLLQPIADGLKLGIKEFILPGGSYTTTFQFAPISLLTVSLSCWVFIPFGVNNVFVDSDISMLFVLGLSALGVYGIVAAGWASQSRYALLGALRAIAQLVSYEIALGMLILPIIICSGSLNIIDIVESQRDHVWYIVPFFPIAMMFFVTMLAETNRTPFDLPEAEAELVAGFNVEYSATAFAIFFLAEYGSMLVMSSLFAILFLGGWSGGTIVFAFKIMLSVFFYVLVRAKVPRYRYDQLMFIGWRSFLILGFGYLVFTAGLLYAFDGSLYAPDLMWKNFYCLFSQTNFF